MFWCDVYKQINEWMKWTWSKTREGESVNVSHKMCFLSRLTHRCQNEVSLTHANVHSAERRSNYLSQTPACDHIFQMSMSHYLCIVGRIKYIRRVWLQMRRKTKGAQQLLRPKRRRKLKGMKFEIRKSWAWGWSSQNTQVINEQG